MRPLVTRLELKRLSECSQFEDFLVPDARSDTERVRAGLSVNFRLFLLVL